MKYWWDNLDDEEKMTAFAIGGMALAILAITLFFAIPRNEKMKHCKVMWEWTIQLQEYRVCNEDKLGIYEYDYPDCLGHIFGMWDGCVSEPLFKNHEEEMRRVIPDGAYDIRETVDKFNESIRHEDSDGNVTYTENTYYKRHYFYKINRWMPSNTLCASGYDKNPHEPECDLPTYIQDPQLGDKIRNGGHSEEYTVTGEIDSKVKTLTLTKSQWSDLQDNATIYYKRRPLSSEIKDMRIGE